MQLAHNGIRSTVYPGIKTHQVLWAMKGLEGQKFAEFFKVSRWMKTFILVLGSNDCLNNMPHDTGANICKIVMKVRMVAPNATVFVADVPISPEHAKHAVAQWVNQQLFHHLVGADPYGVMFEHRSVIPVRWSLALQEADRIIQNLADKLKRKAVVWEPKGVHITPAG